jgi:hypothetical protein
MSIRKKPFGITLFFIFIAGLFIAVLKPGEWEECMSVSRAEAAGVRGGSAGTVSTVPPAVDINLSNVPYIYQNISNNSRSNYYCRIASALMIRTKGNVGSRPYSSTRSQIESWMKVADDDLKNGYYSANINVVPYGVLYVNSKYDRPTQYENTRYAVTRLAYNGFYYFPGPYNITGVTANVVNYDTGIDMIWNHIKNNKQPVSVVTDMNKLDYYNQGKSYPTWNQARTLHYHVVYGIFEKNGEKYFRVHDPWLAYQTYNIFSKYQYQDIIGMEQMAPAWVYQYGSNEKNLYRPSYTMMVYGY